MTGADRAWAMYLFGAPSQDKGQHAFRRAKAGAGQEADAEKRDHSNACPCSSPCPIPAFPSRSKF